MKRKNKIKYAIITSLFLSLSAFAMNAARNGAAAAGVGLRQYAQALIEDAVIGTRAAVLEVVGTCTPVDKQRVLILLKQINRCNLTDAPSMTLTDDRQKNCLNSLKDQWVRIEGLACKDALLDKTLQLIQDNLLAYIDWAFAAPTPVEWDLRLTQALEQLSDWENTTRKPLYLAPDLGLEKGFSELYQRLSNDMNFVHSKIAESLLKLAKVRLTNLDQFSQETFFQKEIPYSIIAKKLYEQERPGPVSLIHFTTLILHSTAERAKFFLSLEDLGCSLQSGCQPDDLNHSEIYSVFQLTSFLGRSDLDRKPWQNSLGHLGLKTRSILNPLFDHHNKLIDALRIGMANQTVPLQEAELDQFEPLAFPLVSLIQESRDLIQTFEKNHQFSQKEKEFLGPFTVEELARVHQNLDTLKQLLEGQKANYQAKKLELARSLQAVNETELRTSSTNALINSVGYELRMAQLDLEGLQNALRKESTALSQLTERSTELLENPEYRNRYADQALTLIAGPRINISARDAHYEPNLQNQSIQQIAAQDVATGGAYQLNLRKGDLVTAEVTGKYSPTCAIEKEYRDVTGLNEALTGPEGFSMNASNRTLQAQSSTETTGNRQTESIQTNNTEYLEGCGSNSVSTGVSGSAGFSLFGVINIGGSVSGSWGHSQPENCRNKITSNVKTTEISHTDNHTNSVEMAQSASFERGMRSAFAPFRTTPVGSLLAVEVDPDSRAVLRTRVIHRNTVFTATQDAELYFIVNDCQKPTAAAAALTVAVSQKRSALERSKIALLLETIADLEANLALNLKHFLEQGDLSGTDLDTIRRELSAVIHQNIATNRYGAIVLSDLPLIGELVQNWIHSEAAQLERKVRIRQAERKIQLLYRKHRDLVNQSMHLSRSSVLNSMIIDWTYQNMDYQALLTGVNRVVNYLNYRVLPTYNTVNPGVLRTASHEFRHSIQAANLDTNPEELARRLIGFIEELRFTEMMHLQPRQQEGQKLVVSFPRPERYELIPGENAQKYQSTSIWPSVSYLEASRFWNAIQNQSNEFSMTIAPNAIYNPNIFFGALNCFQRAPFIKGMSVFFISDNEEKNEALNRLQPQRPILLPEFVEIPNKGGLESYRVPESWRMDTIPLRFSTLDQAFDIVTATRVLANGAARGMTPLGTFTFPNMVSFYPFIRGIGGMDQFKEVLVLFEYEAMPAQPGELEWISNCQDGF